MKPLGSEFSRNFTVKEVVLEVSAGAEIGETTGNAIAFSALHYVNVVFFHNDHRYVVNPNKLINMILEGEKQ